MWPPTAALEEDDACLSEEEGQCGVSLRQLRLEPRAAELGPDSPMGNSAQASPRSGRTYVERRNSYCKRYQTQSFDTPAAAQASCSGPHSRWCKGVMGPQDGRYYMCRDPLRVFDAPSSGSLKGSSLWTPPALTSGPYVVHEHKECNRYSAMKFGSLEDAQAQCSGSSSRWCQGVMGPEDGHYYMCRDPMRMLEAPLASSCSVWALPG